MEAGGTQEAYRWRLHAHHTRPTVYVIEAVETNAGTPEPNTPFGFGRGLRGERREIEPLLFEGEGA